MNEGIRYVGYDEVTDVYRKMMEASGGGLGGVREEQGIRKTLEFVENDEYYLEFADKLTYIVYAFCAGHYSYDGNKRMSLTMGAYFLHKNAMYWQACMFMKQFENIVYHVAASRIDEELLGRTVRCFIENKDYDEELRIDIARAMSKGGTGTGNDTKWAE